MTKKSKINWQTELIHFLRCLFLCFSTHFVLQSNKLCSNIFAQDILSYFGAQCSRQAVLELSAVLKEDQTQQRIQEAALIRPELREGELGSFSTTDSSSTEKTRRGTFDFSLSTCDLVSHEEGNTECKVNKAQHVLIIYPLHHLMHHHHDPNSLASHMVIF